MKGIIFNVYEKFFEHLGKEQDYEDLLEKNGLSETPFVGVETYDDSIFLKLLPKDTDLIKTFGSFLIQQLFVRYKDLLSSYKTPEEVLLNLDDFIHVEVNKIFKEAKTPKFNVEVKNNVVYMKYVSERKFCVLVDGALEGLAKVYNKKVSYHHDKCMHKGNDGCYYEVKFE